MKEEISETAPYADWLKQAFDALEVTPVDVGKKVGESPQKYYKVLRGEARPSFDTIQQLLSAYPRLNANWLLKGQKPILHESGVLIVGVPASGVTRLPLHETTNSYNETPAETMSLLNNDIDLRNCVVARLTDDAMGPRYVKGMRLLARVVPQQDWEYTNSGLFLVLYKSTFVMRRIKENELISKDYLTLYADSPDAGFVTVKRDDLRSIWEVLEIVSGGVK